MKLVQAEVSADFYYPGWKSLRNQGDCILDIHSADADGDTVTVITRRDPNKKPRLGVPRSPNYMSQKHRRKQRYDPRGLFT